VLLREQLGGLPRERWPAVSLAAALAVIEALRDLMHGRPLGLRWPNDVYAQGRKICGILPEMVGGGNGPVLVLGIGINVNNPVAAGPRGVRSIATSMLESVGAAFDLTEVLVRVLRALDRSLDRLSHSDPSLPNDWNRCCLLTARHVRLDLRGTVFQGRCRGIDSCGRLLLATPAGVQAFASGSVISVH
jgi:BirA family biotin operon repressor/biotin-[acetyl-CoA-carboxylase] ligase